MKGKLGLLLFSLPFAGIGLGFLFISIIPTLIDWQRMQSWEPIQGQLVSVNLEVGGSDTTTYEVMASYNYHYFGSRFVGNRVGINSGKDNVGSYHQDKSSQLKYALRNNQAITVWVNPESPHESVLDPSPRWGLLAFKSIFVLVFGGFGLGLLYFALRTKADSGLNAKSLSSEERPWELRKEWSSATIYSNANTGLKFAWGFAIFWNLISTPLLFQLPAEVQKSNYIALIGLLFPLIGLGLLVWAIRATLAWKRFGTSPLTLDPYPGSIGGQLGGNIDINFPYDEQTVFRITASCLYSYVSGTGKNRSRRERVLWQEEGAAHKTISGRGTRIAFCFDVPDELPASEVPEGDYHIWRVHVVAEVPGIDFDRQFEVPVFPTQKTSKAIRKKTVSHPKTQQLLEEQVDSVMQVRQLGDSYELRFPPFRTPGMAFALILFGAIFFGAGVGMYYGDAPLFFSSIFGFVGLLILLGGLYTAVNSLEVDIDFSGLKAVRYILGIPVSRNSIGKDQVSSFSLKQGATSGDGRRQIIYYKIAVQTNDGRSVVIGDSFAGKQHAELALAQIKEMLRFRD